jgi:hypothetical protein
MPTRIYHPDHGYVLSSDDTEIKALLAKGGVIAKEKIQNGKAEETNKTEVLSPSTFRHGKRR